jgi:putative flippase GtrA
MTLHRQISAFVLVGLLAAVAHYGALIALVELADWSPVPATLVGYVAGGLVSYGLNRRHTFSSDRPHEEAGWRFALVALIGFGLTFVSMSVLHERWGKLPWKDCAEPAVQLAEAGFHVPAKQVFVFRELIDEQRLMSDPSVLVTNPTHSDPSLAPDGKQIYYVLFPTPNLDAPIDWKTVGPRYRDEVVRVLEQRGYVGFGDAIEVEHITTPADWSDRGMERGAPFAAAHSFFQTGPFRPGTLWGEKVVFTGSGTQPGVGVPMVLVSGRLAAERVTGKDINYSSRATR